MSAQRNQAALFLTLFASTCIVDYVSSIRVTGIRLQTNNKKDNDYVLHGEAAILSCWYYLPEDEDLTSIQWLKDDEEVYLWRPNQNPVARASFQGRVNLRNKSPNTINITQAHMEMHGAITCRVTASSRTAENMFNLVVIVDACGSDSWKTYTNGVKCTESINMRCSGMFPKPSPKCAIVNEETQAYVISVPLDSTRTLKNGTFEISLNRMYFIENWVNYTDIAFVCSLIVQDTSWKKGIKHKLFGDRGCASEPPEISNGYYNITEGLTCWNTPRDSVQAVYYCNEGYRLENPDVQNLTCRNTSWVFMDRDRVIKDSVLPTCSNSTITESGLFLLLLLVLLSFGSPAFLTVTN